MKAYREAKRRASVLRRTIERLRIREGGTGKRAMSSDSGVVVEKVGIRRISGDMKMIATSSGVAGGTDSHFTTT